MTFAVTGAAATSPTFVLIGETADVTSIPLGILGTLDLGLGFRTSAVASFMTGGTPVPTPF